MEELRSFLLSCREPAWAALPGPREKTGHKPSMEGALQALFVKASLDRARGQAAAGTAAQVSQGKVVGREHEGTGGSRGKGLLGVGKSLFPEADKKQGNDFPVLPRLPAFEDWAACCVAVVSTIRWHQQRALATEPMVVSRPHPSPPPPPDLNKSLHLFSRQWLERAFKDAFDAYADGAPEAYPLSVHEFLVLKAVAMLESSMPSAHFRKCQGALRRRCFAFWAAGKQRCGAVSLTAKPCRLPYLHTGGERVRPVGGAGGSGRQHHGLNHDGLSKDARTMVRHCSGAVSLMACCCGASRSLVDDPFAFASVNRALAPNDTCDAPLWSLLPASMRKARRGGGKQVGDEQAVPDEALLPGWGEQAAAEKGSQQEGVASRLKQAQEQWDVLVLGDRSWYVPTKGVRQPGFLHGQGYLLPWALPEDKAQHADPKPTHVSDKVQTAQATVPKPFEGGPLHVTADEAFPPLPSPMTASQDVPGGIQILRRPGGHAPKPGASAGPRGLHSDASGGGGGGGGPRGVMYLGLEHECPRGHRYFLNHRQVSAKGVQDTAVPEAALDRTGGTLRDGILGTPKASPAAAGAAAAAVGSASGLSSGGVLTAEQLSLAAAVPIFRRCWGCIEEARAGGEPKGRGTHKGSEDVLEEHPYGVEGSTLVGNGIQEEEQGRAKGDKTAQAPSVRRFYASKLSQLRRIVIITPDERWRLATCPTVDAYVALESHNPVHSNSVAARFSLGLPILLPPNSAVSIRMPLVYAVPSSSGEAVQTVVPLRDWPDHTASLVPQSAFFLCDTATEELLRATHETAEDGNPPDWEGWNGGAVGSFGGAPTGR